MSSGPSKEARIGESQKSEKEVAYGESGAAGEPGECPICLMFKEGGCKKQFDDFMDCGIEAEKGSRDYQDCVKMFDAMRDCMKKNPEVFAHLLADVNEAVDGGGGEVAAENRNNASREGKSTD